MSIVRTEFYIQTTDEAFTLPGDLSAERIIADYSSQFPALRSMASTSEVVTVDGVGQVRKITFTARTGTKG